MRSTRLEWLRAILEALVAVGISVLGALDVAAQTPAEQGLTQVPFPNVQNTDISDCSTPTVLDVGGGQKITFTGGQFIHYKDANVEGTVYASSSAAGCQKMEPDLWPEWYLPPPHIPITVVTVSFSKPVPNVTTFVYNYFGAPEPPDFSAMGSVRQDLGLTFRNYDGTWLGNTTGEIFGFPSHWVSPNQLIWYPTNDPVHNPPIPELAFAMYDYQQPSWPYFVPSPQWSWAITSLWIPAVTQDVVKFDYESSSATSDGKILISAAQDDSSYPSPYQIAPPTASNIHVKVSGTLLDGVTKKPKQGTVYLKVSDPPDTAPYRGPDAHDGDNNGPAAHLDNEQDGIATVQADSQGKFQTTLTIMPNGNGIYTAGDNYKITGSPNAQMNCSGECPRSGTFTLWKRLYVEQTKMARNGAFLRANSAVGDNIVSVADGSRFEDLSPGDPVMLMHADVAGEGFYYEYNAFESIDTANGETHVHLQAALGHPFGCPATASGSPVPYTCDGIAVLNEGFFESDDSFTSALFDDAFTEIRQAAGPSADYMPYAGDMPLYISSALASKWFAHRTPGAVSFQPNVIHRISASSAYLVAGSDGSPRVQLGYTTRDSTAHSWNFSFTFVGRIEQATTQLIPFGGQLWKNIVNGLPPLVVEGKTTDHEMVHLWQPGHCGYNRYQDSQDCLMHSAAVTNKQNLGDSIIGLHYVNHGATSEYLDIRRAADPF